MKNQLASALSLIFLAYLLSFIGGCAQIGAPTGGPKDSLAPVLVKANPELLKKNFTGNKITLQFNEYVELQDLQNNLLVSPVQQNNPSVSSNLRTVSIRLKDTLKPNTTYLIQFGDAIKDVNEGNVLKNFSYVFSTGDHIDSLTVSGKVLMAETGKSDSTLLVVLYREAPDSAVQTRKPDYSTRLRGDGSFTFRYLPSANVKVYALKDGDGSKTYNSATETFAFSEKEISTNGPNEPVLLYAFAKEKAASKPPTALKTKQEPKLTYTSNQQNKLQDLLLDLRFDFNNSLKTLDTTKIKLTDTSYNILPVAGITLDSTRKKMTFQINWQPEKDYVLILDKEAIKDSTGNTLPGTDTLRFKTRRLEDYGRVTLRFQNLDLSKNPVIQFIQGEEVKISGTLTSKEWKNTMFIPGEYEMRILYDENRNGRWDPGDYKIQKQPERALALEQKLAVRADWDNERDIEL